MTTPRLSFAWLEFSIGITLGALAALLFFDPPIADARPFADLVLVVAAASVCIHFRSVIVKARAQTPDDPHRNGPPSR